MGCCKTVLAVIVVIAAAAVFLVSRRTFEVPQEFYQDHYWGKQAWKVGQPVPKDDTSIKPRKIAYDEEVVKDLHARLDRTRFEEPLLDDFEYGFNGNYLKQLVQHWRHKFDWKKQVDYLNSFPHFFTQIEGIDVHFVRIKPEGNAKVVKPILLVNGWPSSFSHYYKLAELLKKPVNGVAFEVIIPSRPGFGYSEQPHRPGFSLADSVRVYVKLMKRLGHNKFYYAGEDWGAMEAHAIAVLYPENLEGVHASMVSGSQHSFGTALKVAIGWVLPSLVYSSPIEAQGWGDSPIAVIQRTIKEVGYFALQATKPDTLGASLIDSPAGLAAYYLEKMAAGVNYDFIKLPDGGLTKVVTMDELLTNTMIFWVTGNGAHAVRYYKEFVTTNNRDLTKAKASDKVPFGFTIGENEIAMFKLKPCCKRYNIVKFDYLEGVGHFASFEAPKKIEEHLRKFVQTVIENNANDKKSEM